MLYQEHITLSKRQNIHIVMRTYKYHIRHLQNYAQRL